MSEGPARPPAGARATSRGRRYPRQITRSLRNTLLVLAAALAVGGACLPALAQAELSSGSLTELATKAQQEEESAAATTAKLPANEKREAESPLPGPLVLLGVGAAVALLLGIAFVIVRDARSAAPVAEGALSSGGGARSAEARLRKRRAKAKAARQQRKRNR